MWCNGSWYWLVVVLNSDAFLDLVKGSLPLFLNFFGFVKICLCRIRLDSKVSPMWSTAAFLASVIAIVFVFDVIYFDSSLLASLKVYTVTVLITANNCCDGMNCSVTCLVRSIEFEHYRPNTTDLTRQIYRTLGIFGGFIDVDSSSF